MGDSLFDEVDCSLCSLACNHFGLALLYCVEQVDADILVACALCKRSGINACYRHDVQFGELNNRVVVELIVGLASQVLEANILVTLYSAYEDIYRIGRMRTEVTHSDVGFFEDRRQVSPFACVVADRNAHLRG